MTNRPVLCVACLSALAACMMFSTAAMAQPPPMPSRWGPAFEAPGINTASGEGCPIETEDGRSLLIASNRPGGLGGNDIWVADRPSTDSPWGPPQNLGAPVNSADADFCPSPVHGRYLLFVSDPAGVDECGGDGGDIYLSRQSPAGGWSDPTLLGCSPFGPNTPGGERSPSVVETKYGTFLLYSANGPGGDSDIFVSRLNENGQFGPGRVVRSLSTEYNDFMPNVRAREEGGFEIVFNSDRPDGSLGSQDVYWSWIPRLDLDNWRKPVNLGPNVNTAGSETRATLSADGKRLTFGRDGDIYTSER
jgi:hypothetical protein